MSHQVFSLGVAIDAGPAKESKRLVQGPGFVVATHVLRDGAEIPPHSAPAPIVVTCLAGHGEFLIDGGREVVVLDPGTVLTLPSQVPHSLKAQPFLRVVVVRVG